jgi:signal-transduction protein with cAMP-binding, CBS, and nucleotidyltransferase domain
MSTKMLTMDSRSGLLDVAKKMMEANVSSIAITDDRSGIIGILTERDIVRAIAKSIPLNGVTAGSLMSKPIMSVERCSSVEDAAGVLIQRRVRHLLVQDAVKNEFIGMITATDLVKYLKKNLAKEEIAASEVWELFF